MGELLGWWLAVELLGIAALPLAAVLFARLPDCGWSLAKPLGLLAVGWLIWFPLSMATALPYGRAWIVGTIVAFALGNVALLRLPDVRAALLRMLARERMHIVLTELVFAGAFALMAWVRSFTPAVVDQEKFMDAAFLSAIWRAPHLPPPDPWLSGQPINYYYFGHYLLATLAKLLGTVPAVAFNIGIALIFALTAVAVYGVATDLLAAIHHREGGGLGRAPAAGLVSLVMVLILGNLNGAQVAWQQAVSLSGAPGAPLGNPWAFFTHRELWLGYDWWAPSRVIPNTINEFPAFSFLLADLHAHVLALPFAALALGLALSFVLGRGEGLRVFGDRVTGPVTLIGAAVVLGALYALNGWDLPTYLGLALLALAIQQWLAHDRRIDRVLLLDLFAAAAILVALCVLLYLPFYRGFVSPSQGVGIVPAYARSPVGLEFAIFGLPIVILGSYLVWRLARWVGETLTEWDVAGELVAGADPIARLVSSPRALGAMLVALAAAILVLLTLSTSGFLGWTLLWALLIIGACAALALRNLGMWWELLPRALGGHAEESGDGWGKTRLAAVPGGEAAHIPTPEGETGLAPTVTGRGLTPLSAASVDEGHTDDDSPKAQPALRNARSPDSTPHDAVGERHASPSPSGDKIAQTWLLCLVGTAAALVAACELIFLRDVFAGGANGPLGDAFRMNTVFKLYYQAWLIAGVASGPALVVLLRAAWGYVEPLFPPRVSVPATMHVSAATSAFAPPAAPPQRPLSDSEAAKAAIEAREGAPIAGGHVSLAQRASVAKAETARSSGKSRRAHHWVSPLRYAGAGGIVLWMALLALLAAAALVYPVLGSATRTQNFALPHSLDGTAFMATDATDAGDADAIAWLNAHIAGDPVIVESAKYDEYTHLARVSAFTGLPTIMGWGGHELQWRINWLAQPGRGDVLGERLDAVSQIYTNPDEAAVKRLLQQYSVRLIYVGAAERQTYPSANLDRFAAYLPVIYQREGVTIYAVPEGSST